MTKSPALLLAACATLAGCGASLEHRKASAAIQEESRLRMERVAVKVEAALQKGYTGAVYMPLPIRAPGSTAARPFADRQGLQLDIVSIEPLSGACPVAPGGTQPAGMTVQLESPFWNRNIAAWRVECGKPPRNAFMESFADESGWVRAAPLPVEDAYWNRTRPVPAGAPLVRFMSPVKAVFRLRWEMADKRVTEWETVTVVAGPYEDFLVLSPLSSTSGNVQ